jgi:hypothetical protein
MDLRTGRTYETEEEALKAGVPASDLVQVEPTVDDGPKVRTITNGPFKGRRYVRNERGQMVRVKAGPRFGR